MLDRQAQQSARLLDVAASAAGDPGADGQHAHADDEGAAADQEVTTAEVVLGRTRGLAEQRCGQHPERDDPRDQPDDQRERRADAGVRLAEHGEEPDHRQCEEDQVGDQREAADPGGGVPADGEHHDRRTAQQQRLVQVLDQVDQEDRDGSRREVAHRRSHGLDGVDSARSAIAVPWLRARPAAPARTPAARTSPRETVLWVCHRDLEGFSWQLSGRAPGRLVGPVHTGAHLSIVAHRDNSHRPRSVTDPSDVRSSSGHDRPREPAHRHRHRRPSPGTRSFDAGGRTGLARRGGRSRGSLRRRRRAARDLRRAALGSGAR